MYPCKGDGGKVFGTMQHAQRDDPAQHMNRPKEREKTGRRDRNVVGGPMGTEIVQCIYERVDAVKICRSLEGNRRDARPVVGGEGFLCKWAQ
jgi:hypothetical protein